jgi:opacity protein-like surface antigen
MKNFLFGCTLAFTSLTLPAFAEYCCPSFEPSCCSNDFNGFYVGGNVGVYTNTAHRNDYDGFFATGGTLGTNTTNVTAGVLLGYDMEFCNKLLGVVADWNWVNNRSHHHGATVTDSHRDRFNWFITIRGRAGVTICDALLYLTLGAAVFRHDHRGESSITTGDFRHNNSRWGWVGGPGIEYMLGCNWSVAGELLWLNFSHRNRTFVVDGTSFTIGHSDSAILGRVILNYRFGNLFGFGI